jgi:predicted DNA-binding WGR domain protein
MWIATPSLQWTFTIYSLPVSTGAPCSDPLFGEICLTRRWGRIGAQGQMKIQHFAREQDAVTTFLDLLRRKRSRGYRVS